MLSRRRFRSCPRFLPSSSRRPCCSLRHPRRSTSPRFLLKQERERARESDEDRCRPLTRNSKQRGRYFLAAFHSVTLALFKTLSVMLNTLALDFARNLATLVCQILCDSLCIYEKENECIIERVTSFVFVFDWKKHSRVIPF